MRISNGIPRGQTHGRWHELGHGVDGRLRLVLVLLWRVGNGWLVLGVLCRIWTSDGFPPPRILKTKKFKISAEIDIESVEGSAATSASNDRQTYPLDSVLGIKGTPSVPQNIVFFLRFLRK